MGASTGSEAPGVSRPVARADTCDSLLQAALQSASEGILALDAARRIALHTRRFAELCDIPGDVLERGNGDEALQALTGRLAEPAKFLTRIRQIETSPQASTFDLLRFKDGHIVEATSRAHTIGAGVAGRV